MTAIEQLLEIMARLRAEGGCPWDREQTLASLKQYLVEECYEVIDAIDSGDPARHEEELGDLLLQVVFQAQVRKEEGAFDFEGVARRICEKLIRRHPHVFGETRVADSSEVLRNWDRIKLSEKDAARTAGKEAPAGASLIPDVPRHLPALHKAHQVQKRAARLGFDWSAAHEILAKIDEELAEVRAALAAGKAGAVKEEIGDLLFAVANLSRFQGLSPEEALGATVDKFIRRFRAMEALARSNQAELSKCTPAQMDAYWNQVKESEKS